MSRAATPEALDPLLDLCRAGKLFEVQEWIKRGGPVAPPERSRGRRIPLRVALERGFHSLVQVLLEAGAPVRDGSYVALDHAVSLRRPDLASLLLAHGADVGDVPMQYVIEMWQPEMVELFIGRGASLTRDNPVAWGLVHKIRPVLGLLKRFGPEQPELMRQAELALRFHADKGNAKWVALLLWAGADPWSKGPDRLEDADDVTDDDDELGYLNAVELAVAGGKLELFTQRKLRAALDPGRPEAVGLLDHACRAPTDEALLLLLERGHRPKLLADRGTAAIVSLLCWMSIEVPVERFVPGPGAEQRRGIDSYRAKEQMRRVHLLVANGAKWLPRDKRAISDARRYLLKMAPDYTLEFVWMMQRYGAARRRDVRELLRTPTMVRLVSREPERLSRLVAQIPEEVPEGEHGDHASAPAATRDSSQGIEPRDADGHRLSKRRTDRGRTA